MMWRWRRIARWVQSPRCLPAYRFCFAQRGIPEQSMGIHYNKGAELLDFVKNKEDFSMDGGFFKPLTKPGLGVDIDEAG